MKVKLIGKKERDESIFFVLIAYVFSRTTIYLYIYKLHNNNNETRVNKRSCKNKH